MVGFSTGIGVTIGPVVWGGWPLTTGLLGAGGAGVPGFAAAPGFDAGAGPGCGVGVPCLGVAGGGGGGISMYFRGKSETMSRFSETFAFN